VIGPVIEDVITTLPPVRFSNCGMQALTHRNVLLRLVVIT